MNVSQDSRRVQDWRWTYSREWKRQGEEYIPIAQIRKMDEFISEFINKFVKEKDSMSEVKRTRISEYLKSEDAKNIIKFVMWIEEENEGAHDEIENKEVAVLVEEKIETKTKEVSRNIDWSKAIYCKICNRRLRPANKRIEDYPGTMVHQKGQLCISCKKRKDAGLTPKTWTKLKDRKKVERNDKGEMLCKWCQIFKDPEFFTFKKMSAQTKKIKRSAICRPCRTLQTHNLTFDRYNEIIKEQKGSCPICLELLSLSKHQKGNVIDHDHSCCPGKVSCGDCIRGIIHNECNSIIGFANDDTVVLSRAIQYLNRWEEVKNA